MRYAGVAWNRTATCDSVVALKQPVVGSLVKTYSVPGVAGAAPCRSNSVTGTPLRSFFSKVLGSKSTPIGLVAKASE